MTELGNAGSVGRAYLQKQTSTLQHPLYYLGPMDGEMRRTKALFVDLPA